MKTSFGLFALLCLCLCLLFVAGTTAAPVALPAPQAPQNLKAPQAKQAPAQPAKTAPSATAAGAAQGGPYLPLPEAGETLLSYLDRLLSGLPLLGKLLAGIGYTRPK
ncbi:hypothetical protein LPJ53_003496 [Coemansia erecta]|uniref:Uncharacterized protein n=1 Tax=Coemansia erecta TaxID=147472 RepID=A0A9W7Y176_9FUNG|nr:hypothetical protein LPJ53_003496 [Coemansia erecta]